VTARRRLRAQTELTAAADRRTDERAEELRVASQALDQAREQRTAAEEETRAAAAGRAAAEEAARAAEERATAAIADATAARTESEASQAEAERAVLERDEARAESERAVIERDEARAAADRAAAEAAGVNEQPAGARGQDGSDTATADGVDAAFLWALERTRSERTWRQSVALNPDEESVFDGADDPLIEAIRVDLEAAREEVGVVVELDAELAASLSPAGSLLTLRATQELLASVVRRTESSVVRLRVEGDDVIVTIEAVDEQGDSVAVPPLADSSRVSAVDGGVRVHNAVLR
jgi:hypothetical protein